ncbi:hypothetical protein [Methyloceanibacter caenitepidi]|uniref:hypothetical protein n=1 Tax=Methyloceanibacter caenitepidi TaxID=1384459 RepID=UPI0005EE2484|nr:hypothetical protein [Methyloceanibacter caenitepidi]
MTPLIDAIRELATCVEASRVGNKGLCPVVEVVVDYSTYRDLERAVAREAEESAGQLFFLPPDRLKLPSIEVCGVTVRPKL